VENDDGARVDIGRWWSNQRTAQNAGTLTAEQERQMKTIDGLKRAPTGLEEVWTDKCKLVHQYVVEHGKSPPQQNCTVVNDDGVRVDIGGWWNNQRTAQNAGKLTAARELQMKTIDGLNRAPTRQEVWNAKCKLVQQYVVEHGKSPPSRDCTVVNDDGVRVDIGRWWSKQRTAQNAGKLTAEQELQMKTIDGLKRAPTRQEEVWTDKCKLVQQYVVEHGKSPPFRDCKVVNDDGVRVDIGGWWNNQRTARNTGKLTAERERQMKTIDGLKRAPTRLEEVSGSKRSKFAK
jgi:hypothetical protein